MNILTKALLGGGVLLLLATNASPSLNAQSSDIVGISLASSESCPLEVNGVRVKRARVYGRRIDILKALRAETTLKVKDCGCAFDPSDMAECVFNKAQRISTAGIGDIPPGQIKIMIDDGGALANAYKAASDGSGCELIKEICINSKGEVSFGVECDGFGAEISTSGHVKITVGGVTVPVRKGE